MQDPRPTWTPAGQGERYEPLPGFLKLPVRGWRKLSPRGKRVAAALAAALVAGIAIAWPFVVRDRNAGERERAALAAQHKAASLRELREDQRPRHDVLTPSQRARIHAGGGLQASTAAALVATQLEASISADVRDRIAAGKLEGDVRETECNAVKVRSRTGADFNCFAFTGEASGYRFSARAQLPAGTLAWCKENPRPLHPTSFVLTVPISSECR